MNNCEYIPENYLSPLYVLSVRFYPILFLSIRPPTFVTLLQGLYFLSFFFPA